MPAGADRLWSRVDALVDHADAIDGLRAHRLQLLAAAGWEQRGLAVPPELRAERHRAAAMALAAPVLLRRARDAYDGELMLFKGPEAAAAYRDPAGRYFCDLDLFATDPRAAQRALIAAGFLEDELPDGWEVGHHLPALHWPGMPLGIELHLTPKLPSWLPVPSAHELLSGAVPSATGIDGLLAPDPAAHALLLAAHAWAHRPLGRLGDLIDVAAVAGDEHRAQAAALAKRWGWSGMWRLTTASIDAVLYGHGRRPAVVSLFGRHLSQVRDPSVLDYHLLRLLAPVAAAPRSRAAAVLADGLMRLGRKWNGERWRDKLGRAAAAALHAAGAKSSHDLSINNNPWER